MPERKQMQTLMQMPLKLKANRNNKKVTYTEQAARICNFFHLLIPALRYLTVKRYPSPRTVMR